MPRKLAQRLMPTEQWKGIIAVKPRWSGAECLTRLVNWVSVMWILSAFPAMIKPSARYESPLKKKAEGDGEGFIIVDDLVDTGGILLR